MKKTEEQNPENNTKYFELLNSTMEEMAKKSFRNAIGSDRYCYNIGSNLPDFLSSVSNSSIDHRDYQTECLKLREIYTALVKYISEVRRTIPKEILESKYNFFYSIDKFLDGLLEVSHTREIVVNQPALGEYVALVAISHDCIAKAFDIVTNDLLPIIGDHNEA